MIMALRKHQPGSPCCCFFDSSFYIQAWTTLAGTWTSGYRTESQYAIRVSPRRSIPLQVLNVLVSGGTVPQQAYAADVRAGFRNADGDQVYVERTAAGANWQEIVYEQASGGSPVVIIPAITYSPDGGLWGPQLLFDSDYSRFSLWIQYRSVYKVATTKQYDRAFIGTGALTAGDYASFGLHAHYNCLCRYCGKNTDITPTKETKGGIDFGPTEFELTVSDLGYYTDDGWGTYVDCDVVAYYQRKIASATEYSIPFTVPDWLCVWYNQETRQPGVLRRFVWIAYGTVAAGYTSVYVTISVLNTPLNVSPTGERYATWRKDLPGKIDARTLSLTGANAFTVADLIASTFPANSMDDKKIELVASP